MNLLQFSYDIMEIHSASQRMLDLLEIYQIIN